jgi:hypothetical protein
VRELLVLSSSPSSRRRPNSLAVLQSCRMLKSAARARPLYLDRVAHVCLHTHRNSNRDIVLRQLPNRGHRTDWESSLYPDHAVDGETTEILLTREFSCTPPYSFRGYFETLLGRGWQRRSLTSRVSLQCARVNTHSVQSAPPITRLRRDTP